MKQYLLSLWLLCLAAMAAAQQHYHIDARFTGFTNGTKFYLEDVADQDIIVSAVIRNHQFSMTGKAKDIPRIYRLQGTRAVQRALFGHWR